MHFQSQPIAPPEKLVLPKRAAAHIFRAMRRDSKAQIGVNEAQIFDVGTKSHSVLVWRFTHGEIMDFSGPLRHLLMPIATLIREKPTGFGMLEDETGMKGCGFEITLDGESFVKDAIVTETGNTITRMVREFFKVNDWLPHPVMGGRYAILTNDSFEPCPCRCVVSSAHLSHTEAMMRTDKSATLLSFFINLFMGTKPSIDLLESAYKNEQGLFDTPLSCVYIIGVPIANNQIEVAAWHLVPFADIAKIKKLREYIVQKMQKEFGELGSIHMIPEGSIQFRARLWQQLFEESVRDKIVKQIPIVSEEGNEITQFPC